MGFSNPGALFFSALLAVLVLLYLWERQRRRLDVPALLLWERVPDAVVRRSRFQPDLLFFLQLAILSALILGLADPYLRPGAGAGAGARQVVILDTSASMQTREVEGTRLDLAKQAIAEHVSGLDPATEVMLVTVANRPNVEVPFTSDRGRFATALGDVEAVDVGTNLDGALALAVRTADAASLPTRIDVFTDVPAAQIPAAWRDRVSIWPVGATDDNLAIESLRVFQGSFQSPRDARAHVTVRNHSGRESHGSLRLVADGVEVDRQLFSIAPHAAREFAASGFPNGGLVEARLENEDALAVDDTAVSWLRPARHLRVVLVALPSPLVEDLQTIAATGDFLDLTTQSPEQYAASPAAAELVIFHRVVPDTLPAGPCLFVFPEADGGFLAAHSIVKDAEILDWDTAHPALRGLQLRSAFPFARAKVLAVPAWAETLVRARSTDVTLPLIWAGATNGQRIAAFAFDLAAERLLATDHENLLLLFLGLLDWLTADTNPVRVVHTGDVLTSSDLGDAVAIVAPNGRATALAADDRASFTVAHRGSYLVRSARGETLLLANFADARESEIGRTPSTPERAPAPPQATGHVAAGSGIGWLLLLAAAALLLIEWPLARREA